MGKGASECCDLDEFDVEIGRGDAGKGGKKAPKKRDTRKRNRERWGASEKVKSEEPVFDYNLPEDIQLDVLTELKGWRMAKTWNEVSVGRVYSCDARYFNALLGTMALSHVHEFRPGCKTKRSTFLIGCVENDLLTLARKKTASKRGFGITKIPISADDWKEATESGHVSEESISTRRHGHEELFLKLDFKNFLAHLTDREKYWLVCRLNDISFDQLAEWEGCSRNDFRRSFWRPVQEKAIKYGGFEGKLIELA